MMNPAGNGCEELESTPLICLASASPRRRALLDQIGVTHCQVITDVPERVRAGESPEDFVARLALDKAHAGRDLWERNGGGSLPVLGADTAVVVDGEILGKPRDRAHGLAMLARLSGREHQVLSAIALVSGGHSSGRVSSSQVLLRTIGVWEREAYWATGEGRDKAGGYAIQGQGAIFVQCLEGSYSGVMGLPLFETADILREFSIPVL